MSNLWTFPKNSGGEFDGFNDAGIETFRGSPYSSLAREVIQNSLDAKAPKAGKPVRVRFDLIEVPTSDFPDASNLKQSIKKCIQKSEDLGDSDTVEFLQNALKVLSKRSVPCLRMSDENTTGLIGPCSLGNPYYAFMKAKGQSIKVSQDAAGSYGIGKNAPFASSELRTIFVSTMYMEGEPGELLKPKQLAQGKAILMSHHDKDRDLSKGTGYFGLPHNCHPIEPYSEVPGWLRREEQFGDFSLGTTVWVAGFRKISHWKEILLASVISNYFCAISDKSLEVFIDGDMVVSSDTLQNWFEDADIQSAAKEEQKEDELNLAKSLTECLFDSRVKTENAQLPQLRHCRTRLLVREGLPKRVGIIRNGMLVTRRMKGLIQFPGYSDFVALVDCLNPKGNSLLRSMENPEHNDFQPERRNKKEEIKKGREELLRLAQNVRTQLKKHAQEELGPVTVLDELSDFFQDPEEDERLPGAQDGEIDLEGLMTLQARPQRQRPPPPPDLVEDRESEEGGAGSGIDGKGSSEGGFGSGEGAGTGDGGTKGRREGHPVELLDVRCRVLSKKKTKHAIYFTPTTTGVGTVKLEVAGADSFDSLNVKSVIKGGGKVQGGKILGVALKKDHRAELEIELEEAFQGAMRVTASAV